MQHVLGPMVRVHMWAERAKLAVLKEESPMPEQSEGSASIRAEQSEGSTAFKSERSEAGTVVQPEMVSVTLAQHTDALHDLESDATVEDTGVVVANEGEAGHVEDGAK